MTRSQRFCLVAIAGLGGCMLSACSLAASSDAMAPRTSIDALRLTDLDRNQAVRQPDSDLLWYDATALSIEGKGWADTRHEYERLPAYAESVVPSAVWQLSRHTAGLCVRFVTDSTQIGAIWDGGGAMNHMAATGNSGLDLYARRNGRWTFCGVGRPETTRTTALLAKDLPGTLTEYLLYLPLYNDVTELRVGVEASARLATAPNRPKNGAKPIVFYGTSITQGGCASRSGMCHPAILGRWLDREVVNLGFSGAGKMEPELAELLSELDPAVFVLDCLPNMTTAMVRDRVEPFVHILRKARPETPILVVENPINARANPQNLALRDALKRLQKRGEKNLHCLAGETLLDGQENGTVDGVHPTDLGFFRMALAFRPVLEDLLAHER